MQDSAAFRRVADFGVELEAVERTAAVTNRGDRTGIGFGQRDEIAVDRGHLIAVAHPDDGFRRHVGK